MSTLSSISSTTTVNLSQLNSVNMQKDSDGDNDRAKEAIEKPEPVNNSSTLGTIINTVA